MGSGDQLARKALIEPDAVARELLDDYDQRIGDVFVGLDTIYDQPLDTSHFSTRSVTTLRRLGCESWSDVANLRVVNLWRTEGAGRDTILRILTVLAQLNVGLVAKLKKKARRELLRRHSEEGRLALLQVSRSDVESERFDSFLRSLAAWGVRERGVERLSDIVSLSSKLGTIPADLRFQFEALGNRPLREFMDPGEYEFTASLANEFVQAVSDRPSFFLARCVKLGDRSTLAELGAEAGLTRERVRQLALKAEVKAAECRREKRFAPLEWRARDLSEALGVLVPFQTAAVQSAIDEAARDLLDIDGCTVGELLLWLAGPYKLEGEWLIRSDETIKTMISKLAPDGLITTVADASNLAAAQGVQVSFFPNLEDLWPGWRRISDNLLVRWTGSLADKAECVLRLALHPMSPTELNQHIGEGHSAGTLQNALASDDRFMKLNKGNQYGLRSWGLEEYSGIAVEIAERLERAGGQVSLEDLVVDLVEHFGVSANSVRMYAHSPAFVVEDGMVRNRDENEAYHVNSEVSRVAGLYLDHDDVIYHLLVDDDVLRGSGRRLPNAAAVALAVTPGRRRVFTHLDTGSEVVISWPVTATMGASLGSIRALAQHVSAQRGDYVRLHLFNERNECAVEVVDPTSLSGLTGLEFSNGNELSVLAAAMDTDEASVRARLQSRGDGKVLKLLPVVRQSPELEHALSQFGELIV